MNSLQMVFLGFMVMSTSVIFGGLVEQSDSGGEVLLWVSLALVSFVVGISFVWNGLGQIAI